MHIKASCELCKVFSYGNSLMLTSTVLVFTQKLGDAQHSITHKFNNTDTTKAKTLDHIKNNCKL